MPNSNAAPTPLASSSVASPTSSEIENRSTPGIEGTSSRTPSPATTNSGWIRCRGESSVSATRSRSGFVRRSRRIRVAGKLTANDSTGGFSLGRESTQRQSRDDAVGGGESRELQEGDPEAAGARVERAGEGVERRVEREDPAHDFDHVEEPGADRARGDQRDERDRQRDHEGEQRARPDLARRGTDRRPEGGER